MTKMKKSEIVPNLLVRSARWSDVLILSAPNSRGMVRCRVWASDGEREISLPWQVLRWS
jgi:hypothetical protein